MLQRFQSSWQEKQAIIAQGVYGFAPGELGAYGGEPNPPGCVSELGVWKAS